ncbi:MAG: DMT family transporter [Flavobacterium sp.]|nr:DMT family transporter [Flavobacterium sp.]
MKTLWIIMAFFSGFFLPLQGGINARLGKELQSPIYASLISFLIGATAIMVFIFLSDQTVSWGGIKTAPAYTWIGGILGAFYVTTIILCVPKIGSTLTFGLVIAGQMVAAVVMDHFKIFVSEQHPINLIRIVGILLIISGVIIIKKF